MKTQTLLAIEAFEAVERAELAAFKKRAELGKYHIPEEDMDEYYRLTEDIRHTYSMKMEAVMQS